MVGQKTGLFLSVDTIQYDILSAVENSLIQHTN